MGQYYKAVNIDKKEFVSPSGGVKLMEWNWVGNHTVGTLLTLLKGKWKGDRVIIAGDYYTDEGDNKFGYDEDFNFYNVDDLDWKEHPVEEINIEKGFLINETKKLFVDISNVPEDEDGWKISSTILLACGNGRGGGDYRAEADEELVGDWAGDNISFSENKPKGYEELKVGFKEW